MPQSNQTRLLQTDDSELWNGLSSDVVDAVSVVSFKSRLDRHWKEYVFALEVQQQSTTCR